jgi:choline transport protein
MSEEIKNARMNVPRAMLASVCINGALGFGMLLAVLYCAGDLEAAAASPTGYPFIEIFIQATNSIGGATAMTAVIITIAFSATIGTVAAASRQLWAFARDRGVPGWYTLGKVSTVLLSIFATSVLMNSI